MSISLTPTYSAARAAFAFTDDGSRPAAPPLTLAIELHWYGDLAISTGRLDTFSLSFGLQYDPLSREIGVQNLQTMT